MVDLLQWLRIQQLNILHKNANSQCTVSETESGAWMNMALLFVFPTLVCVCVCVCAHVCVCVCVRWGSTTCYVYILVLMFIIYGPASMHMYRHCILVNTHAPEKYAGTVYSTGI